MEHTSITPSIPNAIVDKEGKTYRSISNLARLLGINKDKISFALKKQGYFATEDNVYKTLGSKVTAEPAYAEAPAQSYSKHDKEALSLLAENNVSSKELKQILDDNKTIKNVRALQFNHQEIKFSQREDGHRYAITLFSDAHIEETVHPNTVLGMNEYNLDIARERIRRYFVNLVDCLKEDKVHDLIFASLGDTITSYLHDENVSENQCTPLEAVYLAQNMIYDGLKYICDHADLSSIQFIGIVGNHSRTTKKIQHSNGYKMSYEWLMYKNLQKECELNGLPVTFYIPESEMFIADMDDGRRFLFMHGFQIKGSGTNTVCGIYPALNRLFMKLSNTFHQTHMFLGHFHSLTSIPHATVNGSIISWNTFAMTNGMPYEEPMQAYVVYDSEVGELLSRKIYCK